MFGTIITFDIIKYHNYCNDIIGGALVPIGQDDDIAVVIGLASYIINFGCGFKEYPSIFVYVPYYTEWIQTLMK